MVNFNDGHHLLTCNTGSTNAALPLTYLIRLQYVQTVK